ncbi:MAG: hypothetical protein K6T90_06130 [Leptolyngbyaceae cyanobacterium HOT.MB2.61]|nr:hypothetical protein [Leptolyngbyaceae cyanobacterium HOT.MB2.61]
MTNYEQIERWREIVMSAFTMVSLFADAFNRVCPLSGIGASLHAASLVGQPTGLKKSA